MRGCVVGLAALASAILVVVFLWAASAQAQDFQWEKAIDLRGAGRVTSPPFFTKGILEISFWFQATLEKSLFFIEVWKPGFDLPIDMPLSVSGSKSGKTFFYGVGWIYFKINASGKWKVTAKTATSPASWKP